MTGQELLRLVSRRSQIADRPPRRYRLRGGDDGVGVDTIVAVELGDRTGLAEMLDAKRPDTVAVDGAEPAERRRMGIDDADDAAMARQAGEQPLDVRAGMHQSSFPRAPRRG